MGDVVIVAAGACLLGLGLGLGLILLAGAALALHERAAMATANHEPAGWRNRLREWRQTCDAL